MLYPSIDELRQKVDSRFDAGRALVLVNNKWDLVDEDRRTALAREAERDLAHVAWAPRINLAAYQIIKLKYETYIVPSVLCQFNFAQIGYILTSTPRHHIVDVWGVA